MTTSRLTRGDRPEERGIALITALWGAALLAVTLASVLRLGLTSARAGHSGADLAALNAAADAAVNITILRMLGPAATEPPVDDTPTTVDFAGYRARVSVRDEAGRIDINWVGAPLLRQLLIAATADVDVAQQMTDRILDWRDASTGRRLNGAQSADYRDAGLPYGPRNGAFQSVAELQLVMGMTPELYRRIAPLLTVYSQAPWVDPAFASTAMLTFLAAIDANVAAELRHRQAVQAGFRLPDPNPGVVLGHAFTITADVDGPAASHVTRVAVIRLTALSASPLLIYRWN
jgi:general secretion pathway protein K